VNPARAKLPRLARLSGAAHFIGGFSARRQGVYFTVLFRNKQEKALARLGIVAGRHAVPGSVDRSLMKRTIREVFRNRRGEIGNVDVVVRVRRQADRRNIAEARHELEKLLSQSR
jgi:ribonuclease P protein component